MYINTIVYIRLFILAMLMTFLYQTEVYKCTMHSNEQYHNGGLREYV